jgi:hypothetical protein
MNVITARRINAYAFTAHRIMKVLLQENCHQRFYSFDAVFYRHGCKHPGAGAIAGD